MAEVEVLDISWLPNKAAARVIATKVGDLANRPYTFNLKLHDAEEIIATIKTLPKDNEEPLIIEIDAKHLIPIIRRKAQHEPVPTTPDA